MDPFTVGLVVTGIAGVIGGFVGVRTGEGFGAGFIHGAAWPLNVLESGFDLFQGRFDDAGFHIIGVSDQVIEDINSGEFVERSSKYGNDMFFSSYDYRDVDKHNEEMGRDMIVAISTVVLGAVATKYGSAVKSAVSKGSTFFIAGQVVGEFKALIRDISTELGDLDFENPNAVGFNTVISDIRGSSGSADRFNDNSLANIDVGDLYSTYEVEDEDRRDAV